MAAIFNAAPIKKKGVVELNQSFKYGNARAVIKDPILPAMFMVPETAPEFLFPTSTQSDHDGLNVISAPKTAMDKKITALHALLIYKLTTRPIDAKENPIMAGIILDFVNPLVL